MAKLQRKAGWLSEVGKRSRILLRSQQKAVVAGIMPEPSIKMLSVKSFYSTELDNVLMLFCLAILGLYLCWTSFSHRFDSCTMSSKKDAALRSLSRTKSRRPSSACEQKKRPTLVVNKDGELSGTMSPMRARRNSVDFKKSSWDSRRQSLDGRITAEALGEHLKRASGPNVVGGNEFLTTFGNMPRY